MKDLQKYNIRLWGRMNRVLRHWANKAQRKRLINRDFTLLCNNCNGGVISHDLGLQFRSPTVNLFFYEDHFFKFCEKFDYYISQPLTLCEKPMLKPDIEYPVCNLGDLELHFLHYHSFEEPGRSGKAVQSASTGTIFLSCGLSLKKPTNSGWLVLTSCHFKTKWPSQNGRFRNTRAHSTFPALKTPAWVC